MFYRKIQGRRFKKRMYKKYNSLLPKWRVILCFQKLESGKEGKKEL